MIEVQMDRVRGQPIKGPHTRSTRCTERDRQVEVASGKQKGRLASIRGEKVVKAFIACMQGWRRKHVAGNKTGS